LHEGVFGRGRDVWRPTIEVYPAEPVLVVFSHVADDGQTCVLDGQSGGHGLHFISVVGCSCHDDRFFHLHSAKPRSGLKAIGAVSPTREVCELQFGA
jgi:hypothetical protein